ncbi:MAG: hypothetical protein GQ542_13585 [Desulforhopalus sp.]|nr:hypothetical protein [Desulforhopalus sp.]
MNTQIITKEKTQIDLTNELMSFTLKAGSVLCALIGIWGVACIVAALTNVGPLKMVRGYITAITGL